GEERRASYTDLTQLREEGREDLKTEPPTGILDKLRGRDPARVENPDRIRNHGLLSKAQRALDIAGWSARAQSDVEVFRLVDSEGLTPLLTLLNEASFMKGSALAEVAPEPPVAEGTGAATPLALPGRRRGDERHQT
ncbi:MAG TPA: hypothetical protein PK264_07110, partial [Hyphomicrobiaceae bacterium]|nr:hypothetical protein [Hyphomicrobiaceae bacterium]